MQYWNLVLQYAMGLMGVGLQGTSEDSQFHRVVPCQPLASSDLKAMGRRRLPCVTVIRFLT
jgi:hypothetical protein